MNIWKRLIPQAYNLYKTKWVELAQICAKNYYLHCPRGVLYSKLANGLYLRWFDGKNVHFSAKFVIVFLTVFPHCAVTCEKWVIVFTDFFLPSKKWNMCHHHMPFRSLSSLFEDFKYSLLANVWYIHQILVVAQYAITQSIE